MPDLVGEVLVMLVLFQAKHMLADYYLQTPKMLAGRSSYVHMGRAQHAAVHAVGSALVFLAFGSPPAFILIVIALEWVVHFHIDFGKARYSELRELRPDQAAFWRAAGFDQCLHQLTYLAMTWAWAVFAV